MGTDANEKMTFLESYAKYLSVISVNLILWFSILTFLALYVYGETIWLLSWLFYGFLMFLHALITRRIIQKEIKLHWVLQNEDDEYYIFYIIMICFIINFVLISIDDYFIYIHNMRYVIFTAFLISMQSLTFIGVHNFSFLTSNIKKVQMRLKVAYPNILLLNSKDKTSRCKYIENHFKWFREALTLSNLHISKIYPNNPEVIDIESFYEPFYLTVLQGNEQELNGLKDTIDEFKNSIDNEDFKEYLMSLKRMNKIDYKNDDSLEELSKMFKLRSRFYKLYSPFIRFKTIITSIIVAIVGVFIKIVFEFSLGT